MAHIRLVRPCVFSGAQRFIMVLNYKVNDLLITNVIDCSGWLRQPFVIISNGLIITSRPSEIQFIFINPTELILLLVGRLWWWWWWGVVLVVVVGSGGGGGGGVGGGGGGGGGEWYL